MNPENSISHREHSPDVTESMRIAKAVERALAQDIVREEVFEASRAGCPDAYLLSSSHYGIGEYDVQGTPEHVKESQIQLFQLLHLFQEEGVSSPLYVEGRQREMQYTPFPQKRPTVKVGGTTLDIHDPKAQAELFKHPDVLKKVMDDQQELAEAYANSPPAFYIYTAYSSIEGAHVESTEATAAHFSNVWLPWLKQFKETYKPFWDSLPKDQKEVQIKIATAWDGNGNPLVKLMPDRWSYATEVQEHFQGYLQCANLLAQFDEMREVDLCTFFKQTPEGKIPMGFAGKAHELRIIDRLKDSMNVRVLTPRSSIHQDKKRSHSPVNHPDSTIFNIKTARNIIELISRIPSQPPRR